MPPGLSGPCHKSLHYKPTYSCWQGKGISLPPHRTALLPDVATMAAEASSTPPRTAPKSPAVDASTPTAGSVLAKSVKFVQNAFWSFLPRRKVVVRAMLLAAIAVAPFFFILMIAKPLIVLPVCATAAAIGYALNVSTSLHFSQEWAIRQMAWRYYCCTSRLRVGVLLRLEPGARCLCVVNQKSSVSEFRPFVRCVSNILHLSTRALYSSLAAFSEPVSAVAR
eukprot:6211170-Pleurochrysis_carterae.AAC.2